MGCLEGTSGSLGWVLVAPGRVLASLGLDARLLALSCLHSGLLASPALDSAPSRSLCTDCQPLARSRAGVLARSRPRVDLPWPKLRFDLPWPKPRFDLP